MDIFLSFVITTRNKKEMLNELLVSLFACLDDDEEIIVVDSESTDGTVDILKSYQDSESSFTFISESDVGEAHGFNKGIALARGEYIKIVSDDDIYDWNQVKIIKEILMNEALDVVFTNGITTTNKGEIVTLEYDKAFSVWKEENTPFAFCGLGLFIRRRSLPLLGYFSTSYKRVDAEYSLRVTSIPSISIELFTEKMWIRRLNPSSNSVRLKSEIRNEMIKLLLVYSGFRGLTSWLINRFIYSPKAISIEEYNLGFNDGLSILNKINK
jgi:glycosyltransferase involved in cell wall biosynthesis